MTIERSAMPSTGLPPGLPLATPTPRHARAARREYPEPLNPETAHA